MKNLLLASLLAFSFPIFSEDIGVSDDFLERFSSLPSYSQAKLSPDGKVISVIFKIDEKEAAKIILSKLKSGRPKSTFKLDIYFSVNELMNKKKISRQSRNKKN